MTGYALQIVTADLLIRGLAWSHLVLGIVYSVGVAAHWPATRGGKEALERADPAVVPDEVLQARALDGIPMPGRDRPRSPSRRVST